jgi:hypothetical protein
MVLALTTDGELAGGAVSNVVVQGKLVVRGSSGIVDNGSER